jgi:hypothetical protein
MALASGFEIKEFNAASLVAGYLVFGTVLTNPCYEATIINESNVAVYVSVDGTTNSFRIGAGKTLPLSVLPREKTLTKGEYLLNKGTQLYIKQTTAAGIGIIVFNAQLTR